MLACAQISEAARQAVLATVPHHPQRSLNGDLSFVSIGTPITVTAPFFSDVDVDTFFLLQEEGNLLRRRGVRRRGVLPFSRGWVMPYSI